MGHELSKNEIIAEVVKSGKDAAYFINTYARISHPLDGDIPFNMYDYQEDLVGNFNEHRFNVILKARQLGISTVTGAYIAWLMIFHKEKNVLVVATKYKTAANLVKKVKSIVKSLPPMFKSVSHITADNRTSFELSNGSQIQPSSTTSDAGRSEALSLLVVDEAAHVEGLEELWKGLYPTLSTGGRCIALSTPNGVGNWFHQIFVGSEEKTNKFFPTTLKWDAHPDRDQEWYDEETKNMSRRDIAQELECNFNMSGETVFHSDSMDKIGMSVREPKYRTGMDRNFWIWEEFQEGATYVLSADVARGDGKDFSAFHIFKIETMEIVAEYRGKPTPDLFSTILNDAGREYGDCMVVVENNSFGWSVLTKLQDEAYPNLYYSYKSTHEYADPATGETSNRTVPGFTMSMKTRPQVVAKMEEFVRNGLITVYSSRLYNEMKTFVWNNGKAQSMRGFNDDLILSCAIGCWVKDLVYTVGQRDIEYKKAFMESMMCSSTKINTSIPGMIGYRKIAEDEEKEKYKEFSWILKG